jgi:hypothetical protein
MATHRDRVHYTSSGTYTIEHSSPSVFVAKMIDDSAEREVVNDQRLQLHPSIHPPACRDRIFETPKDPIVLSAYALAKPRSVAIT